jgi:hypothetical protein
MRDRDQWLAEIFVGKADRLEHRASRRARRPIDEHAAVGS